MFCLNLIRTDPTLHRFRTNLHIYKLAKEKSTGRLEARPDGQNQASRTFE